MKYIENICIAVGELALAIFAIGIAPAAYAGPPGVTYSSECVQNGGTVQCVPPDKPAPVRGARIADIDMYNGCGRIGAIGGEANNGQSTYRVDEGNPGDPLPAPYTAVLNYCVGFPSNQQGYFPRLLFYGSFCSDAYTGVANDGTLCAPRCTSDKEWSQDRGTCIVVLESFKTNKLPGCGETSGNPIVTAVGVKQQAIDLGLTIGGIQLALTYNSSPILLPRLDRFESPVHPYWRLNLHRRIYLNSDGSAISAVRGDGTVLTFLKQGANFVADADSRERFVKSGVNYVLYSDRERLIELYNAEGRLSAIHSFSGRKIDFVYSDNTTPPTVASAPGLLIGIVDDLDGSIQLRYDSATKRLTSLFAQKTSQTPVNLGYDAGGRLSNIVFQDESSKTLEYTDTAHPTALTGILHEDAVSHSAYAYDSYGRAFSTGMTGVAGVSIGFTGAPVVSTVEIYNPSTQVLAKTHEWSVPSTVNVTPPNGVASVQSFGSVLGFPRLLSSSQPAGAGCAAATRTQQFDANGNVIQRDDFNGYRTCTGFDTSRNLETVRVEGLANTASCANVTPANATLPAGTRKTSTQWHASWRLQTKVAEPRRLTTLVYNGQPDPFDGGAIASCAPASALLPDGSPIAVLCKQVEQATTDTDGSKGLNAVLDSSVASRVQRWTYNQSGQVLTATDPRDTKTTYAYYGDTTADHTLGDLYTVTNAKQQVTTFTKYNSAGQWLEMKDVNDVLTTRTFDPRQRLKSVTTGTALTSFDYWPTGLLKKVTLPDGSSLGYRYDDAQRLTSITDSLGNSVTYTLDDSGNRTVEDVKDPSGKLVKTLTRVPDALNRIQQVTGRP